MSTRKKRQYDMYVGVAAYARINKQSLNKAFQKPKRIHYEVQRANRDEFVGRSFYCPSPVIPSLGKPFTIIDIWLDYLNDCRIIVDDEAKFADLETVDSLRARLKSGYYVEIVEPTSKLEDLL